MLQPSEYGASVQKASKLVVLELASHQSPTSDLKTKARRLKKQSTHASRGGHTQHAPGEPLAGRPDCCGRCSPPLLLLRSHSASCSAAVPPAALASPRAGGGPPRGFADAAADAATL